MKYKISIKKPDGKWWSVGSVEIKDGVKPRISIKRSAEFDAAFNVTPETGWLPLYLFDDKPRVAQPAQESAETGLDDSINF